MIELRMTMKQFARQGLVAALMSSVLVTTAAGEALVLHEHGMRSVHMHFLGWGDLHSQAAWSSRFGHISFPNPNPQSASQRVRIVAVIAIGSMFVTPAGGEDAAELGLFLRQGHPIASTAQAYEPPVAEFRYSLLSDHLSRSAASLILIRNHILLI